MVAQQTINEVLRRFLPSYSFERRFDDGKNQNAVLLRSGFGVSVVLKVWNDCSFAWANECRTVVDRAKEAGWPTPAWLQLGELDDGTLFVIQELAIGEPSTTVDQSLASSLIAVNRKQDGLAQPSPLLFDHTLHVHEVLFGNKNDWLSGLRRFSDSADTLVGIVLDNVDESYKLPTDDLVHGDYNRWNLLSTNNRVTSLIDLDNLGWGSRALDLTDQFRQMILFSDPTSARRLLRSEVESAVGIRGFHTCFAFWVVANLGWLQQAKPEEAVRRIDKLMTFVRSAEFCNDGHAL